MLLLYCIMSSPLWAIFNMSTFFHDLLQVPLQIWIFWCIVGPLTFAILTNVGCYGSIGSKSLGARTADGQDLGSEGSREPTNTSKVDEEAGDLTQRGPR